MGQQIIKQPNGKYCILESITDNITFYNMTPEEVVDVMVVEQREIIKKQVARIVEQLEKGEQPYKFYTLDYNAALDMIRDIHGKKEADKIIKLIEKLG